MFQADKEVQLYRGTLSEDKKNEVISRSKPSMTYNVYADESGKTQENLIVGSLWILNGVGTIDLIKEITKFKKYHNITSEFHFKNINNGNLEVYMQFIDLLHAHSTTFSFKALFIKRKGLKHVEPALKQMFYHLLCLGVKHENETGRAPLPRSLNFDKDLENEGPDQLLLAEIKDRLKSFSLNEFKDELHLGEFRAVDSEDVIFVQIADLFTSSINRIKNTNGSGPKDCFANKFLDVFGMKLFEENDDVLGDCTAILDIVE